MSIVRETRCRATGATVQIVDARLSLDFDEAEGGRWVTWCDTHETFVQHETLADARYHAADSATWCGLCAEGLD